MSDSRHNTGLTLIEVMVTLTIIIILAALIWKMSGRLEDQLFESRQKATFAILDSALEQFYEYGYLYNPPYNELRFPLDCNEFGVVRLQTTLAQAMGAGSVQITNHDESQMPVCLEYSGCEVLYYFLSSVPEVKHTLSKINPSLLTNENVRGEKIQIMVDDGLSKPFTRVIDPWGTTLKYDYYEVNPDDGLPLAGTQRTFPVLISAGPDKTFNTDDDISSQGM